MKWPVFQWMFSQFLVHPVCKNLTVAESPQTKLLMSSICCGQTVGLSLVCLMLAKAKSPWNKQAKM